MTKKQSEQLNQYIERFKIEKPLYTMDFKSSILIPYRYGNAISEFISFMYKEQLVQGDYDDILGLLIKTKDVKNFISNLSEHDCLLLLTGFIRQDRFFDGFLASQIENNNVENVVVRLNEF